MSSRLPNDENATLLDAVAILALSMLVGLPACSEDGGPTPSADGGDTSVRKDSSERTDVQDAKGGVDSSAPDGARDTSPPDARNGTDDTSSEDTRPEDTSPRDTDTRDVEPDLGSDDGASDTGPDSEGDTMELDTVGDTTPPNDTTTDAPSDGSPSDTFADGKTADTSPDDAAGDIQVDAGTWGSTSLQWADMIGTGVKDGGRGAAAAVTSNHVYVAGYTNAKLGNQTHSGGTDVFVAKYDLSGNQKWQRQFGSSGSELPEDIATDSSGDVYVVGEAEQGLHGKSYNGGGADGFVLKIDPSGNRLWTRMIGTSDFDVAVGVDARTAAYVTGRTGQDLNGRNHQGGINDAFTLKLDASGSTTWTRLDGTNYLDEGRGVVADSSGNVYTVGQTNTGLDGRMHHGGEDGFIVARDSSGTRKWTRVIGTSGDDFAEDVAVGPSGAVYVGGWAAGGLGGRPYAGGRWDGFVSKYTATGSRKWTRMTGIADDDGVRGLSVTSSHVYLGGEIFLGLASEAFVEKLTTSGSRVWKWRLSYNAISGTAVHVEGVASDGSGAPYAAGRSMGAIGGATYHGGKYDGYLLKLQP